MKRILLLSIVITLCFSHVASASPTVVLDGGPVQFGFPPIIDNGRILVPLRAVFEAVGAVVKWDSETQTIIAEKGSNNIKLIIGGQSFKNGQEVELDTPAKIIEDHTMVPLRFAAESLDYSVSWDRTTETVTISSEEFYNDCQKAQNYLSNMGFHTENYKPQNNNNQDVLTSSSIILFQFKIGLRITGQADSDTLSALEQCLKDGMTYDYIMKLQGKQLQPLSNNPEDNGRLDKNAMTIMPATKGRQAFLPEITAVGWATLVQAAAKDPNNNMDRFLLKSSDAGYRSYEEQVNGFNSKGPALNAKPGTSPHGWGIAIDLNTLDQQTGRAQSYEVKWLEKNAAAFSFTPCNHAVNGILWEPYFSDGRINFYETWHWNYRPE